MISLLYHSHTVVPAHLAELEAMGLVERGEEILVALDGVLLDGDGRRLSGPTLHDYCLISNLRLILWARDYGRHLCVAFPLAELIAIEGAGTDPLHATLTLSLAAPGAAEAEERYTLTLLPLADLHPALSLSRTAAAAAREAQEQGLDARSAGPAVLAALSELVYGHADGLRPGEAPYRWPGSPQQEPAAPGLAFQQDPASLPPGQIYAAGRLARSAWDTLRRSLREADLPFELGNGSLRELTEAVRAVNDLVHTVASNPAAQQMALAYLNRQQGQPPAAPTAPQPTASAAELPAEAAVEQPREYREIPLRRKGAMPAPSALAPADVRTSPRPASPPPPAPTSSERHEIPLRRRVAAAAAKLAASPPRPVAISGSGDASVEEDRR